MKKYIIGYITGIMTMLFVVVTATILYNAKDVEFASKDSNWNVDNVEDAINDIKDNYTPNSEVENIIKSFGSWHFDYSGSIQKFKTPITGVYKLETWGAQGGTALCNGSLCTAGGYGAYSYALIKLNANEELFIGIGGKGTNGSKSSNATGGYNGGGNGTWDNSDDESSGAGGGATHIAFSTGTLQEIGVSNLDKVIIVSGGGGGASYKNYAGNGGGYLGGINSTTSQNPVNQKTGYSFGKGQNASGVAASDGVGGGGGGLYGGYANNVGGKSAGSGGSGYIGNARISEGVMYCYNCTTSTEIGIKTETNTCVNSIATEKCSKQGNGYAKITLVSID